MSKIITIYLVGWNESFLIRMINAEWKSLFGDSFQVVLYDNQSDDGTAEIAKELGWEVILFSTNGKMDDLTHMKIKEECWKECETQWCVVSDFDEVTVLTPQDLNADFNIVRCTGYEMFHDKTELSEVTMGVPSIGYSKVTAWKPKEFEHITIEAGQHNVIPVCKEGYEVKFNAKEIKLLHFKWTSWEYGINRAHILAKKQSEHNKERNWSFHFGLPDATHKEYYDNGMRDREKVR